MISLQLPVGLMRKAAEKHAREARCLTGPGGQGRVKQFLKRVEMPLAARNRRLN